LDPKGYYATLGVSEEATEHEIAQAYIRLVKKYHPDLFLDPIAKSIATEKMKEINAAYQVLSDVNSRLEYSSKYVIDANNNSNNSNSSNDYRHTVNDNNKDNKYHYDSHKKSTISQWSYTMISIFLLVMYSLHYYYINSNSNNNHNHNNNDSTSSYRSK
jgi:DnaJ-class molecular chaperone